VLFTVQLKCSFHELCMHKDVQRKLNSCTATVILIISVVTAHLTNATLRHFVAVRDFTRLSLHVRMEAKNVSQEVSSYIPTYTLRLPEYKNLDVATMLNAMVRTRFAIHAL